MILNLAKDWPVFILVGIVVFFLTWAAISTRKEERKDKENEEKKKQNQKK